MKWPGDDAMKDMSNEEFSDLCESTRRNCLEAKKKKAKPFGGKKAPPFGKGGKKPFGGKKAPPFGKKESRQQMRSMQQEIKQHLSRAAKLSTEMVQLIKSEDGGRERVAAFKTEMRLAQETIKNAYKALSGR